MSTAKAGMKLALATAVFLFSWQAEAAVPGCPTPPADAVAFAPAEADFVVSAQLSRLEGQYAGQKLLQLAALDLQIGEWLRLREACFASDAPGAVVELSVVGSASGEFVWLFRGEGVATESKVECVADWFARRDEGIAPWTAADSSLGACIRSYESKSSRAMTAIAVENHTLVIASAGWFDPALMSLQDGQLRATDLNEAAKLARHPSSQIWAAGTLHRAPGYLSQVPWRDTVRNLALRAELSDGLSIRVAAGTSDFAAALTRAVAGNLPRLFAHLVERGVPQSLLGNIEVSRAGELFLARWELDRRKLRSLASTLSGIVLGGGLL